MRDLTLKDPECKADDVSKEELQMLLKREHEKFLKMEEELHKKQYGEEVARLQKEVKDLEAEVKMTRLFDKIVPYQKEFTKGE